MRFACFPAFVVLNVIPVAKPRMDSFELVGIPSARANETPVVGTTVPWDIESGGFIYQFHVIEKPPMSGPVIKPPPVVFSLRNSSEFFTIDGSTGRPY